MKLTYPAALGAVVILALLPTVVAMLFFDAPTWLLSSPFSPKAFLLGCLAIAITLLHLALKAVRCGKPGVAAQVMERVVSEPTVLIVPVALLLLSTYPALVFSFVKDSIPEIIPFYLDPILVTADRWLFLGHDPWRVSHALFGTMGTIVLDKVYVAWFALIPVLAVWIVGSDDRNFQLRGLVTVFFIWIVLGNYAALLLSSCGPVFYETYYGSDHFAPLMTELHAADEISPLTMLPISQHLLEARQSGTLGSGISAMPSVHVALTWLMHLLVWEHYRRPWAVTITLAFTALIWIGSFHLAWHYAWDGIVSILAVWAFWKLTGLVEIEPAASVEDAPLLA